MSYILDALKKIEQKRDREDPLRKPTFSGELPRERKKRALWPYLVFAALLLNAAVIITFLAGSPKPDKGGTVAQATLPPQPVPAETIEGLKSAKQAVIDQKEVSPKKEIAPPSTPRPAEKRAPETVTPTPPAKAVPAGRVQAAPRPVQEKGSVPPQDRVYGLNELPPGVRSALPEFKVSGHAYSPEKQTRVARVNDKILQEGQDLAPGLKVEEIVPNGIIFGYQGYRFRVPIDVNR